MNVINVADIVEANGKTWRENNLARQHNFPIGSLVEVVDSGLRLYVQLHKRDCDGTPLYTLTFDKEMCGVELPKLPDDFAERADALALQIWPGNENAIVAAKCMLIEMHAIKKGCSDHGYPEEALSLIREVQNESNS